MRWALILGQKLESHGLLKQIPIVLIIAPSPEAIKKIKKYIMVKNSYS
jgi:hypothetical protein